MVIIGLLTGFAFGIKLTALIFLFALVAAIWYVKGGMRAFMAAFFLVFGSVLLLRLDEHSLLRSYHLSANILQWVFLVAGLGMVVYLFLKHKKTFHQLIRSSVIITSFFVLPVLPWLGKNYAETESFSTYNLLNGKKALPDINIQTLRKNWKKTYE